PYSLTDRPAAYESIEISWINPAVITTGKIHFSVLGSWMREKNIDPTHVVLLRSHDLVWTELPTTFDHTNGDIYYYNSDTPGFSYFAVSERRTTPAASATPLVTVSRTAEVQPASPLGTATAITTSVPTKTRTPVPATPAPEAGSGSPVLYYLAGGVIVVLLIAGFFIGKRWRRVRQNPKL
ncbi:MAG: PGF-pre-PGF domain-containing protein, partial [Methanoregula sp.]|nr:PGF-pre-PGF domain-containing protein [Methanoregula sp.]